MQPLGELVARTEGLQPWRRIFHTANGLLLAGLPGILELSWRVTVVSLAAIVVTAFLCDLARLRFETLNRHFFRLFSRLASPREAASIASSSWYVLGALLVYAFFPAQAVPAILVLALADPAASVSGRLWGRRPLGTGTVLGSTVFLGVAFLVLLPFVGASVALVAALIVAAAEVAPLGLDDNLAVPLAAAVALRLVAG